MAEIVQANWMLIVAALVIGLLVAWWIFVASRRTTVQLEDRDESEGAPAKRNQALIDAPPAAIKDAATRDAAIAASAASPGAVSAAANSDATAAAPLGTDAEAGDGVPAATALADGDDLTRIKGLGPKLVALLGEMGVTTFAQVAAWSDADIDRVDAQLGRFQGRIRRDNWVEQAKMLQTGDMAAYQDKFGRTQ